MQPKPDQRQLAQDLFLHTDKTRLEIADILNVNRKTLYLWIRNGKWEEMKIAARQAPGIILQNIYNHIEQINSRIYSRPATDRCPTMQEVEMMRKLLRMTNDVDRFHTGSYMQAYMELMKFINKRDPALARKVTPLTDEYIKAHVLNSELADYYDLENDVNDAIKALDNDEKKQAGEAAASNTGIVPRKVVIPINPAGDKEISSPEITSEGENNGASWANDGVTGPTCLNATETATVKHPGENNDTTDAPGCPTGFFLGNEATPSPIDTNSAEVPPAHTAAYYASLPPSQRPSPFREGNIIWVNRIDDINDDERKMGDSIRLYPA